ncbi:MAG: hypothetical protein SVE93_06595 [Candidatus Thermoplasmatota archaeon]|nr:hypothetical protein [Candidatus Thermoplasmatota archaeon]
MDEVVFAESLEELQRMRFNETYYMENFGNYSITITDVHVEHKPISILPLTEGVEPYPIVVGIEDGKEVVAPGENVGIWMERTWNCTGRYEITRLSVDYIYEENIAQT